MSVRGQEGDVVLVAHVRFDVLEADERRLLSVKASNMTLAANATTDERATFGRRR